MKPEYQIYCILHHTGLSPRKDPFPTLEEAEAAVEVMPPLGIYERGYTILPIYRPTALPAEQQKILSQTPATVVEIEMFSNAFCDKIALNLETPDPPKPGDFIIGK